MPVSFFLHESFPEEEVVIVPRNGIATLDLVAVGGFTIGAWVQGSEVLLELDLSEIKNAPKIIKEA